MKRKKRKQKINMSDKAIKFKILRYKENENETDRINYLSEMIIFSSFFSLLIQSLLSIKWLYEYRNIFTIHRYINTHFSLYFPIQISSSFLYILDFLLILILIIPCNYFIIKKLINIVKKQNIDSFEKMPKIIIVPIISNSFLFLLGKVIYYHHSLRKNLYYIGLVVDLISLFSLLKINLEKNIEKNFFQIKYESNFIKDIFEKYFFEILLGFNLYYLFYVICQIFDFFFDNLNIDNYLGIIANTFFGIVCICINFELKSIFFSNFIIIIFFGIFHFQFSIRLEERKEINLGNGEKMLSIISIFCNFFEILYIFYKNENFF